MKTKSSSLTARVAAATPFFLMSLFLCVFALSSLSAGNRRAHRLARAGAAPATSVPAPFSGTYDPHVFPCATPRHHFTVGPNQVRIVVQASATVPTNDLTVSLLYGSDPNPVLIHTEDTATSSEAYSYQPAGGLAPGEYQVQICQTPTPNGVPQMAPFDYNGTFTVDDTGPAGTPPPQFGAIPPAPQDSGPKIGFENFPAPGALIPVTTTSAGLQVASVEYMGRNGGEPSVGNNWLTDATVFYSDLETLFVNFDDNCPLNGLSATWVNRPAPTAQAVNSDPIGFTDSKTGRSFSGQLTLLTPTCKTSFSDDDGNTWVPTQGSGLASGVDHQTIGGGPFAPPLTRPSGVPGLYPNAIYYCSQEGAPASGPPSFCSRSDDGGLTYGPSVPLTTPPVNVCGGLHGHVKVSPKDGAAYVPFNSCGGVGSLLVSLDNGTTWTVRHVQTSTIATMPSPSFQDPALSIDANGRIYYVISNADTVAAVLTSDDHGATWQNLGEISSVYGLQNIRYPAAVAGDAGRAAVAFYGTKTPGDALAPGFQGLWHLYVANTFDGGVHWTTTDATPNAPIQRGCIWAKGGANICRNLLDFFDMTIDRDGRAIVGYVNGCEGGNCVQAPVTAQGEGLPGQGNAYTATATIARQSSGRRLFAAKDPASSTAKPGMPFLTQRRVGNTVHLQWSEADTGNLTISGYQILRGNASGAETQIATVPGTQTGGSYDDVLSANDTTTYFYKVVAVNSAGPSCGNNEAAAPYLGTTCSGMVIHRNDPTHPEANEAKGSTPRSLLIDYVAVAEPANSSNFLFQMKVSDLSGALPPNSRWRIAWDSFAAAGYPPVPNPDPTGDPLVAQQFYVGMTTDANGVPSFEYGTLADAGLPAVFVISETKRGDALSAQPFQSGYTPDGTINIYVPKAVVGNPTPGTLLGGVNGRTLTGDVPGSPESKLERSNAFIDHTFVKAQTDQSYPASTYLVTGNNFCTAGGIAPIGAVSRKTHGAAGDFDIDLPLAGTPGVECRSGGPNGDHKVLITFPGPVTFSSATCGGQPAASTSTSGGTVTVNCTGVPNAQTVAITLTNVADGANIGNVSVPMGVLLGDTTGNRAVNSSDVAQTQAQSGLPVRSSNFREDVTVNGEINSSDIATVQSKSGTALP